MIVATGSSAFALGTPLRVDALIRMAVNEALGPRAPQDRRERMLRSTLAGVRAGSFLLDIDGRFFDRLDDTVMCAGTATLRFFLRRSVRTTT
jgi:hypothetical protein